MSKPKVYVETTVISYQTSRPSRDLIVAAHQQMTREWWEKALPLFEPYLSDIVLDEISLGDKAAAQERLNIASKFGLLEVNEKIGALADEYHRRLEIPSRARADSFHLALSAWHGLDYLVTWNCTHIASGRVRLALEEVNARHGIRTPIICTPEELMES